MFATILTRADMMGAAAEEVNPIVTTTRAGNEKSREDAFVSGLIPVASHVS